MIFRLTASVVALASAVGAQDLTQDLLEQPGIVWIAADIPPVVRQDHLGITIPYLEFEDGEAKGGYLSINFRLSPAAYCEDVSGCRSRFNQAIPFLSDYTIEDNVVLTDGTDSGVWIVEDAQNSDRIISQHPMAMASSPFRVSGSTIVHLGDGGELAFWPIPYEHRFAALNVAFALEQSLRDTYACTTGAMFDLYQVPEADWTDAQIQLDALARTSGAVVWRMHDAAILSEAELAGGLDADDLERLEQTQVEQTVLTITLSMLQQDFRDQLQTGRDAVFDVTLNEIASFADSFGGRAPDPDAVKSFVERMMPDMLLAMPLFTRIQAAPEGPTAGYLAEICGGTR